MEHKITGDINVRCKNCILLEKEVKHATLAAKYEADYARTIRDDHDELYMLVANIFPYIPMDVPGYKALRNIFFYEESEDKNA